MTGSRARGTGGLGLVRTFLWCWESFVRLVRAGGAVGSGVGGYFWVWETEGMISLELTKRNSKDRTYCEDVERSNW